MGDQQKGSAREAVLSKLSESWRVKGDSLVAMDEGRNAIWDVDGIAELYRDCARELEEALSTKPSPTSPAPDNNIGWIKCHVCGARADLDIAVICEKCGRAVHKLCTGADDATCAKCARWGRDHG